MNAASASTTADNDNLIKRATTDSQNVYTNAAVSIAACQLLESLGQHCAECDNMPMFSAADLCRSGASDNQRTQTSTNNIAPLLKLALGHSTTAPNARQTASSAQTATKNIAPLLKLALGHATTLPNARQTASTSLLTGSLLPTGTLLSAPTDSASNDEDGLFHLRLLKAAKTADNLDEPCECEEENADPSTSLSASAAASATQAVNARNLDSLFSSLSLTTTASSSMSSSTAAFDVKKLLKAFEHSSSASTASSTTAADPIETAYTLERRDILSETTMESLSETSTAYSTSESASPTGGYTGFESNDDGVMDSAQTEYEDSEDMPVYV